MVTPASVNFNAPPEINFSRRSFIPVGEVGEFAKNSGEFTPEELEVIKKTPFLASRIEAARDKGTIIGYRDSYKNRSDLVEARQAYNLAVNNPKEFYKSEFPAYLGSNDPTAATQLVQTLSDLGETPDSLKSLYESSLVSAPDYSMTYDEKVAINRATQGANDPLGLQQYLRPIFTTIGGIAGGPVGAAVMNSLVQLGETGKIDPKETATAAAAAYVGEQLSTPDGTGEAAGQSVGGTPGVSEVYPVDMSVGGTVTPLAPIGVATGVPANQVAYPGIPVEQTFTPAPGSLQEALPEFGVQTQASTPPYTAAPGSFEAAVGGGLLASAAPALSLNDAFRAARLGQSLLGGEQQQQQYPTQQLPGLQAGAVDLLSLPQLSASRAQIAGLLNPPVYRGPMFDIYSGLPTSLLG